MITTLQLADIYSCPYSRADKWSKCISDAMDANEINTILRQAHFLAQIGHESGRLVYVRELATGDAYEGRKDLGNTQPGDGRRFRGRGLIQITGRANYQYYGELMGLDLLDNPTFLEIPQYAADSAALFWVEHHCNELADDDDLLRITKKINGGTNGLQDRQALLTAAKNELGIPL